MRKQAVRRSIRVFMSTLKQPVDDDVGAIADLESEIDGFVQMQPQLGMHLLDRFDRSRDRLANSLPRTFGIELLATAATEALRRFDLIQNGLPFISRFLLTRWIVEAGCFLKLCVDLLQAIAVAFESLHVDHFADGTSRPLFG